jgi:hypothetical protein
MTYQEKKQHTLSLDIDVGKGSKVQNKKFNIPITYSYPSSTDGGADQLVKQDGGYEIYTTINGTETLIGTGGSVKANGQITITNKAALLQSTQGLPGGNDVTQSKLNFAMANGGNINLQRNGQEKRNANLTLEQQTKLVTNNALNTGEIEANGLTTADVKSSEEIDSTGSDTDNDGEVNEDVNIETTSSSLNPIKFRTSSQNFGTMQFPENMDKLEQDYIKFRTYRYEPQTFKNAGEIGFSDVVPGKLEGTCYLSISGGAEDANAVGWGNNEVNPLKAFAYEAAYNAIIDGGNGLGKSLENAKNTLAGKSTEAKKFIAMQAAQAASQTTNMLSRTSGGILNPNMVLLFQKPELRNFTFSYQLRPRNSAEAIQVRRIIRMFKQSMSVRKESTNLFLLAPNVYKISYHRGGTSDSGNHQSIGRAKICALKSVNINYIPDGSYMTFNDSAATMTAYSMSLSFTEMEPLYYEDYDEIPTDQIGF